MKKHKRDKTDTIVSRGYQAGTLKHLWLSGWREGREDNWSGLKGVSSIHRLNV